MDFDDYDSYAPIAPTVAPLRRSRARSALAAVSCVLACGGVAAVLVRGPARPAPTVVQPDRQAVPRAGSH